MRDDRYRSTPLARPVRKFCRMTDRESDRAHPERLLEQAVVALAAEANRELSPGFRRILAQGENASDLFWQHELARTAKSGLEVQTPVGYYAYDPRTLNDRVPDQKPNGRIMGRNERAAAAAAISNMCEFGRLPDTPHGIAVLKREASLAGRSDPEAAEKNLLRLVQRHRLEWGEFVNSVPKEGWFRQMVDQL